MEEIFNEFEAGKAYEPISPPVPEKEAKTIEIGNDVVQIIAGIAASKTPGVAAMTGGGTGFAEILGRKNLAKGVRVEIEEEKADIDVYILAKHNANLGKLFLQLQQNVKEAVENMTGLTVNSVSVYTEGIAPEEEISLED